MGLKDTIANVGLLKDPQDALARLRLLDFLRSSVPAYEEETIVTVVGNPKSKNSDLFNQAVAIAFGQTKNVFLGGVTPTPFIADAQYDLMHKSVTVKLRYMFNGLASGAFSPVLIDRFFNQPPGDNLYAGKENNVWFETIISLQGSEDLKKAVDNKNVVAWGNQDDIAAGKPSKRANLPPADNGSRGTFLEKLVLNALGVECRPNDAWSSVRDNKNLVTLPSTPSSSGSFVTGVGLTLTGLVQDINASLSGSVETTSQEASNIAGSINSLVGGLYQNLISMG